MQERLGHLNSVPSGSQVATSRATWSFRLRNEAQRLLGAMAPRTPVWFFLSDRDREYRAVPIQNLLPPLRRKIHAIVGGDTTIACEPQGCPVLLPGAGGYVASNGTTMHERTLVCLICLPPGLTDPQRHELLELFIDYGLTTNQEIVQVIAGLTTCWLPTGELIDALAASEARRKEVRLTNGVGARAMNGRGRTMQKRIQRSNNPNGARRKPGPGGRNGTFRRNGGKT